MKKTPPEIRILPDDIANRIAAGEVVERPAAVAKELLENAVDAGAGRIEIEFKHGGKSFIKVSDDGCAMTRQQALTSLEPHATSKIRTPEDLFSISSYGFRGEAVPSIASVSKFKIRTRPESQVFGTEIDVYAGVVNSVRDCGMAAGTEIIVENLFCSVPARKKFLKSDSVEASHIIKFCKLYALALPDIAFTLIENSRVVFRSERGISTLERIGRIFGAEISDKLFELPEFSKDGVSIKGAILKVGESFPTSRNICTFINGRPVECKAVYSAIKEAYSQYIPKGRFASAFLFIALPPDTVDVNVHPAKREVRLKNEFVVRDILFEAISSTLEKSLRFEKITQTNSDNVKKEKFASEDLQYAEDKLQMPELTGSRVSFEMPKPAFTPKTSVSKQPYKLPESFEEKVDCDKVDNFISSKRISSVDNTEKSRLSQKETDNHIAQKIEALSSDWRYIGCFKKRFVIFETSKGLVLMSISASLKRVRFEEILSALRGKKVESQKLLIAVPLKFDRADDEYFSANRLAFESCGFEIEDFGKSFYRIVALPSWVKYAEAENFIRDFVEIAREENKTLKKTAMSEENFARTLVGRIGSASFECSQASALELLARLLSCDNHILSPEGQPTIKEISESELARMFFM